MSEGFKDKVQVSIDNNEVKKLIKDYKKIKKYMKSSIFEVKNLYGTEKIVSKLLEEYKDDPL